MRTRAQFEIQMKTIQSPPLLGLILLGFLGVALPLIAGIITAIAQVDKLAENSGQNLISVQRNTLTGGLLVDRMTEMERSARQYQILVDESYKDLYEQHRQETVLLFEALSNLSHNETLISLITRAQQSELAANIVVERISTDITVGELESAFSMLRQDVIAIVQEQNKAAEILRNDMPKQASRSQGLLITQAVLVIPISIAFAIIFAIFIARPLRQINHGIRSLGNGNLNDSIKVSGTRDLQELGRQLELLRLRLLELETQKGQFLRNVSHELKTPLTNIREGAELLISSTDKTVNTEQFTISRILRDNSVRLQRMIEELLRFGSNGDMSSKPLRENVPLHQLIKDTIEKHQLALTARSIELKNHLLSTDVTGDSKRLAIIVDNLLSNAIKYTPTKGQITIKLQAQGQAAILDIIDSGPGVPENEKTQLFEWFFSGSRPPQSIIVGTGMGLAIAQEYAQQHNGSVQLMPSVKGAHFRLQLPLGTTD